MIISELPTPSFILNRHAILKNCINASKNICEIHTSEQDQREQRTEFHQKDDDATNNNAAFQESTLLSDVERRHNSTISKSIRLRPHVKTHKTKEGAFIQAFLRYPDMNYDDRATRTPSSPECDKNSITIQSKIVGFVASTVPEIEMLYQAAIKYKTDTLTLSNPFGDVIYGVPISSSKMPAILKLQKQFQDINSTSSISSNTIHLLVDHIEHIHLLKEFKPDDNYKWSVYIKLDTGYHRAGVPIDESSVDLAYYILTCNHVKLKGLYSHCGHAYDTNDQIQLDNITLVDYEKIQTFLSMLSKRLSKEKETNSSFSTTIKSATEFIASLHISVGSTPSMFHHNHIKHLTQISNPIEVHPGNYTFYDRQQLWSGSCADEKDVAVRVLARVISHYRDRNTIMLDVGALGLSKDTSPQGGFCSISNHPDLECYKVSQEVTLVRKKNEEKNKIHMDVFPFDDFPIGSVVTLVPNHSCLTAACYDKYFVIDDKSGLFLPSEPVIDEWIPCKGW